MKLALENLRLALHDFELSVSAELEGRLIGVLGASGAGKTTLLEIIAGLRRPRAGRVLLDGEALCDGVHGIPARNRRVGYVPQDLALFPHLTVRANLAYGMPAQPGVHTLPAVAAMLEISPLLDRMPAALSGGEKQRVAFARAVLAGPRLLLLDEPLSSLDHPLKERILPHLLRIRDETGIPMIYVTHSADEAMRLCDHLLVLEAGRGVAQGAPDELLAPTAETHYRLRTN
ncbi:MAG: ATP-binding cassette domain-containing protein [Chthoniobacterales bacterium]